MTFNSLLAAITLSFTLAACGGSQSADKANPAGASTAGTDHHAQCVTTMERARDCSDEYIAGLVDVRIKLDIPAGIAQDAQTNGRDALIQTAMSEWQGGDSTDEAFAAMCNNVVSALSPEQLDEMSQTTSGCMAQDSCSDFTACVMPMHEQHIQQRAAAKAAQ